jgi:hypothetical protein
MSRSTLLSLTVLTVLTLARPALAGGFNPLGRFFGVGWSDGYHAQNVARLSGNDHPGKVPWWATPAAGPEALPHPAQPARPAIPPPGPSLFRQPGEGLSIIIEPAAPPAP